MPDSISTNTNQERTLRSFLVPSFPEALLYCLLGLIVLAILKQDVLYQAVLKGSQVSGRDVVFSDSTTGLLYRFTDILGVFSTFMVWAFIGSLCYTAVWLFRNTVHSISTDVKSSAPAAASRQRQPYWRSQTAKYLAIPIVLIGIVSYAYFLIKATRLLVLNSGGSLYSLSHQNIVMWAALSAVFLACGIYLLKLLLRALVYVFRLLNVGD